MKTSTLAATCLTLLIAAPDARADHGIYRALDDLAFGAMHDVREARWEIHDHFDTSRDFRALLEDADELTHALRDIQDAVYREDRPERLSRLIDAALEGEEVVIARRGVPLVRLVPVPQKSKGTQLGRRKGRGWIAPDFDDPLPDFEPYTK